MENLLVSVVIPSYNRATLIKETLNSILIQTYPTWEAIIVDDGSTDNSLAVLKAFSEKDNRIKYYRRGAGSVKGAPSCRNIGLSYAKGEYVIFLDSDDLLAPWCLESRVEMMGKHKELDFGVFPGITFINTPGDTDKLWNEFNNSDDLKRFISGDGPWQTASPIWKRQCLRQVGEWEESVLRMQDWEFHIRAILKGLTYSKFDILPDLFIRRENNDSISSNAYSQLKLLSVINVVVNVIKQLDQKSLLSNQFKKYLSGYLFRAAENIIIHNVAIDVKEVLKIIDTYKLWSKADYLLASNYLYLLKFCKNNGIKFLAGASYRAVRVILPSYFTLSNNTHCKTKLPKAEFNKLIENYKNGMLSS
ncbi:MAG TPA: glycosyltransferase family 2 protein [Flavisolibacter sp.]|nr:glycosyltransferase family 2 protein [Flavisolibacter sp.]